MEYRPSESADDLRHYFSLCHHRAAAVREHGERMPLRDPVNHVESQHALKVIMDYRVSSRRTARIRLPGATAR